MHSAILEKTQKIHRVQNRSNNLGQKDMQDLNQVESLTEIVFQSPLEGKTTQFSQEHFGSAE